MKHKFSGGMTIVCIVCLMILLVNCGKSQVSVKFINHSEQTITDIRISSGNSYDQGPNRLHEPLLDGEEIVFDLGKYTSDEVSYGFFVQIYNEESERLDLNDAPELLVDGAVYEVLPEYEYVISLPQ